MVRITSVPNNDVGRKYTSRLAMMPTRMTSAAGDRRHPAEERAAAEEQQADADEQVTSLLGWEWK
jgi:hypothetical protein